MKSTKIFRVISKDKKTNARIGVLYTRKGKIETPLFMPVATKASVKHISSEELEEIGAKAIISNTFILSIKPGSRVIKGLGGIGKFMRFNGINVTDSGGGEKVFITPEKDMEIQNEIGADIAMCLDSMPLLEQSKEQVLEAVRKTTLWAERCKKHHDKLQRNILKNRRQLLFGICQGGVYKDLREKSAKEIVKLDFDGYAIGGLALGETKEQEYNAIEAQKRIIPEEKPVYLMGAGHPAEILEAISRGIDMFDSRFPAQNARRGTLFTSTGKLRILNSKHKGNEKPIDEKCGCKVCKNYSCAYIRHLLLMGEGLGYRLATYHNLYYMQNLIRKTKEAIKKGKFSKFRDNLKELYD